MALQSSGAISISEIRNEEVNNGGMPSSYSLRTLSSQAGKSTPDAMSEFYSYSAAPANSCSLGGTNVASPSATYVSGTIYISGTKSIRISAFGGTSPGSYTNSYFVITGSGNYTRNATRNQTVSTDISLTAGTYPFTIEILSYSGTSGNNATLICL